MLLTSNIPSEIIQCAAFICFAPRLSHLRAVGPHFLVNRTLLEGVKENCAPGSCRVPIIFSKARRKPWKTFGSTLNRNCPGLPWMITGPAQLCRSTLLLFANIPSVIPLIFRKSLSGCSLMSSGAAHLTPLCHTNVCLLPASYYFKALFSLAFLLSWPFRIFLPVYTSVVTPYAVAS